MNILLSECEANPSSISATADFLFLKTCEHVEQWTHKTLPKKVKNPQDIFIFRWSQKKNTLMIFDVWQLCPKIWPPISPRTLPIWTSLVPTSRPASPRLRWGSARPKRHGAWQRTCWRGEWTPKIWTRPLGPRNDHWIIWDHVHLGWWWMILYYLFCFPQLYHVDLGWSWMTLFFSHMNTGVGGCVERCI